MGRMNATDELNLSRYENLRDVRAANYDGIAKSQIRQNATVQVLPLSGRERERAARTSTLRIAMDDTVERKTFSAL